MSDSEVYKIPFAPAPLPFLYSPLRDLHFNRLITDEGHNMGNLGSLLSILFPLLSPFLSSLIPTVTYLSCRHLPFLSSLAFPVVTCPSCRHLPFLSSLTLKFIATAIYICYLESRDLPSIT